MLTVADRAEGLGFAGVSKNRYQVVLKAQLYIPIFYLAKSKC